MSDPKKTSLWPTAVCHRKKKKINETLVFLRLFLHPSVSNNVCLGHRNCLALPLTVDYCCGLLFENKKKAS